MEMNAKFVKGMINNPNVQPNATINRWIAAILLFDFEIRHVPADKHTGADGLSQRPRAPEDEDPDEEFEEWLEDAMSLMYMEEWRPVVWYGAQAGGQREDDGEVRVRMLGTEVLPVDEEGLLPRSDVVEDKDRELHLIKWYLREKKKPKEVDEKKWK